MLNKVLYNSIINKEVEMKKIAVFIIVLLMVLFINSAQATHIYVDGGVSGIWSVDTVFVIGDIDIATRDYLEIDPGVDVIFQGYYKFYVDTNATLSAVGTDENTVNFIAEDPTIGWQGIRFSAASSNSILKFCHIKNGKVSASDLNGGGIFCQSTDMIISNCLIDSCTAVSYGAGIYIETANPTIKNCIIQGNHLTGSTTRGAGIFAQYAVLSIINNLIIGNSCNTSAQGGGICANSCTGSIINSTIIQNSGGQGGGLSFSYSSPIVTNCIIRNNSPTQINTYQCSLTLNYSNIEGGWSGAGNISSDPQFIGCNYGNFFLSQIAAGQGTQSPCVNAGDPSADLVRGTTRTDGVQDSGTVDMGFHYPTFLYIPPPAVTLTPLNPPIQIPSQGGSFQFDLVIVNQDTADYIINFWFDLTFPDGVVYTLSQFTNQSLPSGSEILRYGLTQSIAAVAPPGNYKYKAHIINRVTWEPIDMDSICFEKLAGDNSPKHDNSWKLFGWEDEETLEPVIPQELVLKPAYPNPFNPTTTISFCLPEAENILLEIYDINGCLVVTLINGYQSSGNHQAMFDGSSQASGVYLAKLTTSSKTFIQKLLLIK